MRKSFLLNASSASIQLAATDPDERTNCRTSSVLLIVRGSCFTNPRTNSANRNVLSSKSRGLASSFIFGTWGLTLTWDLALGIWDLPRRQRPWPKIIHQDQATAIFSSAVALHPAEICERAKLESVAQR